MLDKIIKIKEEVSAFKAATQIELDEFRLKYLSKKGQLNSLFDDFKNVANDRKRLVGQHLNDLKNTLTGIYERNKLNLEDNSIVPADNDVTRPGDTLRLGSRHPISIARNKICEIFNRLGFTIAEGPEIEDDWHVFSALNFPQEHPARDMQDTFFITKDPDILLRTHTSSVQVRVMESKKPPIRMIMPGRVFRNEAISTRSHCIFHQVEGLYIAENVSFADLKQTLMFFAREMFGEKTQIRLRPSFFPFTEPSAEMDVSCTCNGKGCNLCKYTGWLEVMGCGMVHPNVLSNCGIDPEKYSGYAFGMGIERIALLKYQIKDIRLYFENDVRFLRQFSSATV
ncbi:MAG: phenylalanine--tRNA ligase subunit alpha [Prevotellaceae bacterium]|jgi:phenylalanyl-tRNA synthetase alpha chain|nr:phenylalanine--tRNA ligase subunit alpha [Prevotellaceae bacterium]